MTTPYEENVILHIGEPAPLFTLPVHPMGTVSLAEFRGRKNVVLAFYPKDNTPGSTKELCDFSDELHKFEAVDTYVLGIPCDTLVSHEAFVEKYGISIPLLAEIGGQVGRSYGAVRGDPYMTDRILFVIDKDGIIRYIREGMPNNVELLAFIRGLQR